MMLKFWIYKLHIIIFLYLGYKITISDTICTSPSDMRGVFIGTDEGLTFTNDTTDTLCTFPSDLTGVFISAHKGSLTFTNDTISGYTTTVPNLAVVSWQCISTSGNKYHLLARERTATFGGTLYLHLCLEMHYVRESTYKYFLGTNLHSFAQDFVEGIVIPDGSTNSPETDIENSCNRDEPYHPGSFIMLVKDETVQAGNSSEQCPDDMLAIFDHVNITDSNGNMDFCSDTTLDVCMDRTMMNFTYNETCTSVKSFSAEGLYTCVHVVVDSGTTYLAVWNNDNTVDDTNTFRFTCFAFEKTGGTVYATEAPRFCNDSDQTATTVGSFNGGNILELSSISQTCPDVESTTAVTAPTTTEPEEVVSASLDMLALLILVLLIPIIILLIFLFRKYLLPKLKRPKKPPVKKEIKHKIDLGRGDLNAKKTFRLHSYQPEDTKKLVPLFKPKKPIKISPIFDPTWEPGKLPFLLPLPKVEPLYHDTLEDYLRARLPRRPSHLSLYSFDSVIFASDP